MKILRCLIYLILMLTITGIIPTLAVILITKFNILAVLTGILAIVLLAKELCI